MIFLTGYITPTHNTKEKGSQVLKLNSLTFNVIPPGLEPGTYCLEGSCSIQLSYGTINQINKILFRKQRREGDSNPRYDFSYACLANMWFQPLTHLSVCNLLCKISEFQQDFSCCLRKGLQI